ncbi:MAG: NAD-dependent epimerase/dehydratase family protein [Planctomycetota bacterium]
MLVTGASGVVGARLAEQLRASGVAVRSVVRAAKASRRLGRTGVEVVEGDLRDSAVLQRACDGCAGVIHCAAATARQSARRDAFWTVNAEVPARLFRVAAEAGVGRMVHVSTTGVHGSLRRWPVDADGPLRPDSLYRRSKLRGERKLVATSRETVSGPELVIARLTSVIGPGTAKTWRSLYDSVALSGVTLVGRGDHPIHLVDIDDAAIGLARCLTRPAAAGQTLMLGGREPIRLIDLMDTVAGVAGVSLRVRRRVPSWPTAAIGRLAIRALSRLGHEPAPLHSLAFLTSPRAYRTDRTWALLEYTPRFDAAQSVARTFASAESTPPDTAGGLTPKQHHADEPEGAMA